MKEYAKEFYKSKSWQKTREAFAKSKCGLCENCLNKGIYKAGEIVHHKIFINSKNINNPDVTLSWENLELLCRECHAERHTRNKRYSFDKTGRLILKNNK